LYKGTRGFTAKPNNHFGTVVEIPLIKVGARQTLQTLMSEETLLCATP
jgi:hypothetical protein